jgi:arsenate reductase
MKDKVKTLTSNELLDILALNGLMVKRPILLAGDTVLVGFKEEEWNVLFLK